MKMVIRLTFLTLLCIFSNLCQAANEADACYNTSGEKFTMNLSVKIDGYLSGHEPVGTEIGQVYFDGGGFYCSYIWVPSPWGGSSMAPSSTQPFSLYLKPGSAISGDICSTGTEGLGISYLDDMGKTLPCSGSEVLLGEIKSPKSGTSVPRKMIAKIIKTSEWLKPGNYPLDINPAAEAKLSIYSRPWTVSVSGVNSVFVPPHEFQIYFPESPLGAPHVSLLLQKATPSTIEGTRTVPMCLYDGDDASSSRTTLTLTDEGSPAPGRLPGQFSVYRLGGNKMAPNDRVDYQVSIINPITGARQEVLRGNTIVWDGTSNRAVQQLVSLPGIPGLSHCIPAPLTLRTPAFGISDKRAGRYTGHLKIIYRPSTT